MSSEEKYCPYCGSLCNSSDAFCNNCGASLDLSVSESAVKISQQEINPFVSYEQPSTTAIEKPVTKQNTLAIISLILGITSVVFIFVPIRFFSLQIIGGFLAIILGGVALRERYKMNIAISGIILGVLGVVLWFLDLFNIFSIWDFIF